MMQQNAPLARILLSPLWRDKPMHRLRLYTIVRNARLKPISR